MKIISKYKDYYDYLMGVYGMDEKIVYERKDEKSGMYKPIFITDKLEMFAFAICGYIYIVHIYNGKFYFGRDVRLLMKVKYAGTDYESWSFKGEHFREQCVVEMHMTKTNVNDKLNCPIVLIKIYRAEREAISKSVRLSDFGFPQIISAHDMYITIGNWLSREKSVTDKRTDLQKIVGHGFDKKKSFRNM